MKPIEALFASIPPRGSGSKLKYDRRRGCFRLSHILPAGHAFPFDFGSIPGTLAQDGDALDVLLPMDAASSRRASSAC